MIIGVDLDNTIVSYETLFYRAALEKGLIPAETPVSKKAVRDHIWGTEGDLPWQYLQAEAYGPRMGEAQRLPGVMAFMREVGSRGDTLYIVSHKTEFARRDSTNTNLRTAAIQWLEAQGFFSDPDIPLSADDVYFESTRDEKIGRILTLGCEVFIDDLEELLAETALDGLQRVLITPEPSETVNAGIAQGTNWKEVSRHVYGS